MSSDISLCSEPNKLKSCIDCVRNPKFYEANCWQSFIEPEIKDGICNFYWHGNLQGATFNYNIYKEVDNEKE